MLEDLSEGAALLIPGTLMLAGGVVLLVAMVVKLLQRLRLQALGVKAKGVVVGFDTQRHRHNEFLHYPRVEYHDQEGVRHEFRASLGASPLLQKFLTRKGQSVTVRYVPGSPGSAQMVSMLNTVLEVGRYGCFGGWLAGAGGVLLLLHRVFF